MMCVAPSEIIVATSPALRLFGNYAEAKISNRYLKDNGRDGKGFFPPSLEDYTDKNIRRLIGRIRLLTDFIHSNNPHVDVILFQQELRTKGVGAVPDIVTHLRTTALYELYEIKPNSNSGRDAGREKLDKLDAICTKFALPYLRGSKYNKDIKIRIFRGLIFGILATAYLQFNLEEDGLIVYRICVDADFSKFPLALIILAIATIVIFILSRGTMPGPSPVLPPGTIIPIIINPIKNPVPVSAFSNLGITNTTNLPAIQTSVGIRAANRPTDVRAIQLLLNDWLGKTTGKLLPVDGVAGPKTLATLAEFQNVYGLQGTLAEPNSPTIQALVANHLNSVADGLDRTFMDDMYLYHDMIRAEEADNNTMLADYLKELGKL